MSSLEALLTRLDAVDVRFPTGVQEQLRLKASSLTMFSGIAMQALEIAKDPECDIHEFVKVVERDEVLAIETLKMANSIRFGGSRKEMNLRQAVIRIGFRQCKSLIIEAGLSSMMKKMTLVEAWVREVLWRHSLTTAWIGIHLNRSLNAGFQGEEFTGGLVHDIGRLLVAACFPDQYAAIDPMGADENPEILAHEYEAIETNHCELGMWLTRKNSLPEPLIDVVRFHHCPERSQHNRRFVALIAASDHMTNHLQRNEATYGYDPKANAAITVLESCGVAQATRRFAEIATKVMDQSLKDVQEALAI